MDKRSARLAALSAEQREVLERRLQRKRLDACVSQDSLPSTQTVVRESAQGNDISSQREEHTPPLRNKNGSKEIGFSLLHFSGDGASASQSKYQLLLESARFVDRQGFSSIWVPERHFQRFGGLYPNPSVIAAALAMITERIQIRAGSVVSPLHNPIRIAEEWAVVDNLSQGRVGISFATGWHPGDFILSPDNYEDRREIMFRGIQTIQKLWAGESVRFSDIKGNEVEITILPRPVQPRLPIWITVSGNPDTWIRAGELGANVLCALISQSLTDLAERVISYRDTLNKHGHDPKKGQVTLMLHTFIGDNTNDVKEKVKEPLCNYLSSFIGQYEYLNPFKDTNVDFKRLNKTDHRALVEFAFERYFRTNSLLGSPSKCAQIIEELCEIGINEIGCLVDFGVDAESVIKSLHYLNELKDQFAPDREKCGADAP